MSLDPARAAVRLAVRRQLEAETGTTGAPVVVACSGGADSLALLAATVAEAGRQGRPGRAGRPGPPGRRVVGAVVDHGLQEWSAEHTAAVVEQMAGLGVDETVSARVEVRAEGLGTEAAAREARYAVLGQVAERFGAASVLLGHTLDDQAETVLLGLARGSGGRSIAGMRRSFEVFRRPLLDVTRAQTEAACAADGIAWWTDPHNADPRFARVRVRRTVLPVLERELGPGVAETLARTAEQLRPDMEALDDLADLAFLQARHEDGIALGEVREQPDAVRTRVLRLAGLAAGSPGSELFHVHVRALDGLVRGTVRGQVQLPGHVTAYRDGDHLRFRRT
jgi:tRNA(Ile)-lysidine synthase